MGYTPVMKSLMGRRGLLALTLLIIAIVCFCFWQNNCIVTTRSDHISPKVPEAFDGFKIVHISDLHNKKFGEGQAYLLSRIDREAPDIIVVTGDLIDRRRYDLDVAMTFIEGAMDIAPVYYVSGNHEAWSGKYHLVKEGLLGAGVIVLDDSGCEIARAGSSIKLFGMSDPAFLTRGYMDGLPTSIVENLDMWSTDEGFKILLSHRPELFNLYCKNGMDLIFAGHAHGGQFRLPLVGGLFAPDQGFFPQYTSGSYSKDGSVMFVSRGLGNSIIPIRIFNRPEIVVVTLKSKP